MTREEQLRAIHEALTTGSRMTHANRAFMELCVDLGIDPLMFDDDEDEEDYDMPNPDNIEGIFDNLTPGDFQRETSAIDTSGLDGEQVGPERFRTWLDPMVDITFQKALTGDDFEPFAVLANCDTQRIFAADPDESPVNWADRLHREAQVMKATCFFLALSTPARSFQDGDDVAHIEPTAEQIDAALDAGQLDVAICWVAMRADEQGSEQCAGMIRLNEVGLPLDQIKGEFTDDNPFARVLGGDRAL